MEEENENEGNNMDKIEDDSSNENEDEESAMDENEDSGSENRNLFFMIVMIRNVFLV